MADMLTQNQIERLGRLVKLAPYFNQEQREGLLKLIRDLKAAEGAEGTMPNSAIADLVRAVPDKLCAEIVRDLKGAGNTVPGGFLSPQAKPLDEALRPDPPKDERPSYMRPEKPRGWQNPIPLEPPSGVAICDEMMDVQDRLDRRDLEKRLRGGG
jgi:hypothetical protein